MAFPCNHQKSNYIPMKVIVSIYLILVLSCSTLLAQGTAAAQEYVFKVLASSGNNSVAKSVSDNSWKALKTGHKITKDDKIMLSANGFLGLVHKSGKTLEIKTPGTYTASQLAEKVTTSNSGINQKYVDFVINEMTKPEKEDINKNRHRNMGVEGKVERGDFDIVVFLPGTSDILSSQAYIKWNKLDDTQQYKISVVDMFDEVLFSAFTSDTSFVLDLTQDKLKDQESYLVSISGKDKPKMQSDKYTINKLDATAAAAVNKSWAKLKEGNEESSMNKIIEASFFEEKKLYLDAIRSYEEAIKMQPNVEDYKTAYKQFLKRNAIAVSQ